MCRTAVEASVWISSKGVRCSGCAHQGGVGNKVLLMHDKVMWVDAAIQLRNVLHDRPPSRLTSRASQDGTTVGSVNNVGAIRAITTCSIRSPSSLHQTHINRSRFGRGGITYHKSKTRRYRRRSASRLRRTHRAAPVVAGCPLRRHL